MIERIKIGECVYEVDSAKLSAALKKCKTENAAEKTIDKAAAKAQKNKGHAKRVAKTKGSSI